MLIENRGFCYALLAKLAYMTKSRKKHRILGGIKVSSRQLSEWGSLGGRPQLYSSPAERARAFRLRKKQEKFGETAQLEERKTYGEVKISRHLTCPHCGKVETDLSRYFDQKGELIKESYWFDTIKGEKFKVKENKFWCKKCSHIYSFLNGEIVVKVVKTAEKRAGSGGERWRRWREQKSKID